MSTGEARPGDGPGPEAGEGAGGPSEEELRAAYEAELSRITSVDVMLQACVSLLNLGGLRLGPPPGVAPAERGAPAGGPRDLEQARDAIDGVRALLGVLERRLPRELGPLRDALSQLPPQVRPRAPRPAGRRMGGTGRTSRRPSRARPERRRPRADPARPSRAGGCGCRGSERRQPPFRWPAR